MDTRKTKEENLTIVVLGTFIPTMFHPSWLKSEKLITDAEAEAANVEIVHPDITRFDIPGMKVEALKERIVFTATDQRYYELLRDLVANIFTVLDRSVVGSFGVNFAAHFPTESEEAWHFIGDSLVPKTTWEKILSGRPGMKSLTVEGKNIFDPAGYLRVKIEPSLLVKYGVFVHNNYHFVPKGDSNIDKVSYLVETLKKHLNDLISNSEEVISKIKGIKHV